MTFQNSALAFQNAIRTGRLSLIPGAANNAGNYMYMGTDSGDNDLFKHSITREYLKGGN